MKATKQVIGRNTLSQYPKTIATFLQLEEPEKYTSHCFRRTAATFLADAGFQVMDLQRAGGWKSKSVAESYVTESQHNKLKIASNIANNTITATNNQSVSNTETCNTPINNVSIDMANASNSYNNTTINIYLPGVPGICVNVHK